MRPSQRVCPGSQNSKRRTPSPSRSSRLEFKGKVEILQLPAPVLRDLKKLAAEVVKEESEKSPMAKKVYASYTKIPDAARRLVSHLGRCLPAVRGAVTIHDIALYFRFGLIAVLALVSVPGDAQEARRPYRVGVVNEAFAATHPTVEGLKAGLREAGLADGRDVTFDIRFTEGDAQAAPPAVAALLKAGVDLIVTSGENPTQAAKDATSDRPDRLHARRRPPGVGPRPEPRRAGGERDGHLGPPDRARREAPRDPEDPGPEPPACLADPLRRATSPRIERSWERVMPRYG